MNRSNCRNLLLCLGTALVGGWLASPSLRAAEAGPVPVRDAQARFQLEAGLRIEAVAAEPLIQSPCALAWDESGRLFVAENPGYPVGPGPGRPPVGAIIELRDRDGDGRSDERIPFAIGLNFPNGLMPWRGGWLVTDSPELLWLADTNHDGRADVREVWFSGFATNQTTQLRACYPTLGPDGWIYVARGWSGGVLRSPKWTNLPPVDLKDGDFRFRPDGSAAEAIGGNAQFGLVLDDIGRRFLVSNRNPLMHAVALPAWWRRMPGLAFSDVVQDVSPSGYEAKVFPISADLTTAGFFTEFISAPHAGTYTSACGIHQHFGALPQSFQGSWFICEPAQNLVQRQIIEPDGPSFRGRRATEGRDFLASPDTWFHPVFAATGPDGALYLADMYRKFIDHPEYLPEDARKKLDFDSGKQMGRIWRIVTDGPSRRPARPRLAGATTAQWVDMLAEANLWTRQTAHRLLVERAPAKAVSLLTAQLNTAPLERASIHAIPAAAFKRLESMGAARLALEPVGGAHLGRARQLRLLADFAEHGASSRISPRWLDRVAGRLLSATLDPSPAVREAAWRVLSERAVEDHPVARADARLIRLWSDDPSPAVRFHVAHCFSRLPGHAALEALVHIVRRDAENRWARAMVLSGLKGREDEFARLFFLAAFEVLPGPPAPPAGFDDSPGLVALAGEMGRLYGANGEGLSRLWRPALDASADRTAWQAALLTGLSRGMREAGKAPADARPLPALAQRFNSGGTGPARLAMITTHAIEAALDAKSPLAARLSAVALLGELDFNRSRGPLERMISPSEPRELQLAAARALAQYSDPEVARFFTAPERWNAFTPPVREAALVALVSRPPFIRILLEALERGDLPLWSIDANRQKMLRRHGDPAIRQRAESVFGAVGGSDRRKVFEEYKSVLTMSGDGRNGRAVFQRVCASCHQHNGEGAKVGPDLTGVRNQPAEALLLHIIVPDAEIYAGFQSYEVETTDGESLSGLLVSETDATVTLRRALGEQDVVPRSRIARLSASRSSLMPAELEKAMTRQELADLLAFLTGR